MRFRAARLLVLSAVVVIVVIAFVFIWRVRSREAYGPAVALCPGPDRYGYTCEGAAAYTYIDATTPTGLVADDAVIRLDLPFPFVFYGREHSGDGRSEIVRDGCQTPGRVSVLWDGRSFVRALTTLNGELRIEWTAST